MVIDHIDNDPTNNSSSNLRYITQAENIRRAPVRRTATYQHKGVSPAKRGRWRAHIWHAGKQIALGQFATPEEARDAYLRAFRRLFA
jgi:hypothetical protein